MQRTRFSLVFSNRGPVASQPKGLKARVSIALTTEEKAAFIKKCHADGVEPSRKARELLRKWLKSGR